MTDATFAAPHWFVDNALGIGAGFVPDILVGRRRRGGGAGERYLSSPLFDGVFDGQGFSIPSVS
jgi:hypothetical protein